MIRVRIRAANYSNDILVPFEVAAKGFLTKDRKIVTGNFAQHPAPNEVFCQP